MSALVLELSKLAREAEKLTALEAKVDEARASRDRRIVSALEAGYSTRAVAEAAGMSHVQVLRIRKGLRVASPRGERREIGEIPPRIGPGP